MNLKLELAEWERFAGSDVGREQGRNGLEFPALDINLQNVNVGVAWEFFYDRRNVRSNSKMIYESGKHHFFASMILG